MLNEIDCAKKNWFGFLIKTKLECEKNFEWLTFTIKNGKLLGKGSLTENGNKYDFTIFCSPFFRGRFERVIVESKKLKEALILILMEMELYVFIIQFMTFIKNHL